MEANTYNQFAFNEFRHKKGYTTVVSRPGLPRHYVAHIVRGSVRITGEGTSFRASAGDVIYFPKGAVYRSVWSADGTGEICFFSFGFKNFPDNGGSAYALQKVGVSKRGLCLLKDAEEDITVTPASVGRFYSFFGEIYPGLSRSDPGQTDRVVSAAIGYMREHPDCTAEEVSRHAGISEPGLYLHFRKALGKTPVKVKHGLIAEAASELLLTTDMPLEEISGRVGISSASYLRKIFVSEKGITPSEFRKKSVPL